MKDKKLVTISIIVGLILGLVATLTILFFKQNELSDAKTEIEDLQFKLDSADAIYNITRDAAKEYEKLYINMLSDYNKLKADFSNMKDERDYYRDMATKYAVPEIEAEMGEIDQLIEEALKGLH